MTESDIRRIIREEIEKERAKDRTIFVTSSVLVRTLDEKLSLLRKELSNGKR